MVGEEVVEVIVEEDEDSGPVYDTNGVEEFIREIKVEDYQVLQELKTIPFEGLGFDMYMDCNSPTLNSNPMASGYDCQLRLEAKDQKLMEAVSLAETSVHIAISCDWWLDAIKCEQM